MIKKRKVEVTVHAVKENILIINGVGETLLAKRKIDIPNIKIENKKAEKSLNILDLKIATIGLYHF